jgi:hypothetical protein
LLNRRRGITATAGSNPALSAIFSQYIVLQKGFWSLTSFFHCERIGSVHESGSINQWIQQLCS